MDSNALQRVVPESEIALGLARKTHARVVSVIAAICGMGLFYKSAQMASSSGRIDGQMLFVLAIAIVALFWAGASRKERVGLAGSAGLYWEDKAHFMSAMERLSTESLVEDGERLREQAALSEERARTQSRWVGEGFASALGYSAMGAGLALAAGIVLFGVAGIDLASLELARSASAAELADAMVAIREARVAMSSGVFLGGMIFSFILLAGGISGAWSNRDGLAGAGGEPCSEASEQAAAIEEILSERKK